MQVTSTLVDRIKNGYVPDISNLEEYVVYKYIKNDNILDTVKDETPVTNFLKNKVILITGASGFLGKLLLEKLLRSSDVKVIYVLGRSKKNVDFEKRLAKILDGEIFSKLKQTLPSYYEKVLPLIGDISKTGLDLSKEDRHILTQNVNIIYHCAATVTFNQHIRKAVETNIRGTEELLKIALECKQLQSFVHVSTAYSNCHRTVVEEKIYDPLISKEQIYDLIEKNTDDVLEKMTPHLVGDLPNTYCLTKQIAENVVHELCLNKIPTCIIRPSIVISTYKEPLKGWIDNLNGPMGIFAGIGVGLIHMISVKYNNKCDIVPADAFTNSCIVASIDTALNRNNKDIPVYNFASGESNSITWKKLVELSALGQRLSSTKSIWHLFLFNSENRYIFEVLFFVLHTIPALLVDLLLFASGRTPMFMKVYKKVRIGLDINTFFTSNEWRFKDDNIKKLYKSLDDSDKRKFNFNIEDIIWNDYVSYCFLGIRQFLVKDPLETLEKGFKRRDLLKLIHYFLVFVLTLSFFAIISHILL